MDKLELSRLIVESLDGTISSANMFKLDQLLSTDEDALKRYVQQMRIYSAFVMQGEIFVYNNSVRDLNEFDFELLNQLAVEERDAPPLNFANNVAEVDEAGKCLRREYAPISMKKVILFFSSLAALITIVFSLVLWNPYHGKKHIATVTADYNARLNNSKDVLGIRLKDGGSEYNLKEGTMELLFDNGVKVVIDSPSYFRLYSEDNMYLNGSLTAIVPSNARGFAIDTANARVVDLGTEFGVNVSSAKETEVHVRKGDVIVSESSPKKSSPVRRLLGAEEACVVNSFGGIENIDYKKSRFRWKIQNAYEQAVLKTAPVCYWRFDSDDRGWLVNEIRHVGFQPDKNKWIGQLEYGEGPALGSSKENVALGLPGNENEYAIFSDRLSELMGKDGLSISMWVCPQMAGSQNIITYTRSHVPGIKYTDQLYITNDNHFAFYVYCPEESLPVSIESEQIELNKWYHVVGTYHDGEYISLYVNGQLANTKKLESDVSSDVLEESCWYLGSPAAFNEEGNENSGFKYKAFRGKVDEISLYNRDLSSDEIMQIYSSTLNIK